MPVIDHVKRAVRMRTAREAEETLKTQLLSIEKEKKALELKGRQLVAEGKSETPEYQVLIDQHRALRGKQRFMEGSEESKKPVKSLSVNEDSSEALDRLKKESNTDLEK